MRKQKSNRAAGKSPAAASEGGVRWVKCNTGFYGAVIICHPAMIRFMVGAHVVQPCGLTESVIFDDRSYTEIDQAEALRLIAKRNRNGVRWLEGLARALDLCNS